MWPRPTWVIMQVAKKAKQSRQLSGAPCCWQGSLRRRQRGLTLAPKPTRGRGRETGWTPSGTPPRRSLLSSWRRFSSCSGTRNVSGAGSGTPWGREPGLLWEKHLPGPWGGSWAHSPATETTHGITHLGGMFSGLLDQSDTQSALFFNASASFSPSTISSSDCKEESQLKKKKKEKERKTDS